MAEGVEGFVLLALMLVIIILRSIVRVRRVGFGGLDLDDYLMPLAGVLCTIVTVAASLVVSQTEGLTNSYMTDEQRANLSPDSQEYANRILGSKIQVIGWTLYAASIWCIKVCVAVFYSRLTAKLAHLQIRVYISYCLIGVTWVVMTLTLLLGCRPMSRYWQISPDPGICQPTNSPLYVYSVLIPDIVTDLYLLSIPLPLLWTVKVSLKKKASLALLFCGVIFVMMAAIIRGVVILTSGPEGAISGSEWAVREEFVAVVVSNLPILHGPIRAAFKKVGLGAVFSTNKSTGDSKPYEGRTIGGGGGGYPLRTPRKSKNATMTAWDSDEQILGENAAPNPGLNSKDIMVAREVAVESESGSLKDPGGWSVSVESAWKGQPQRQGADHV